MLSLPKTLILGATGFVGRHLLAAYRRVDPDTLGTTRRQTANHDGLEFLDLAALRRRVAPQLAFQDREGLQFLDLAAPDLGPLRLRERGCRAAIITAAVAKVDVCERDPYTSRQVNVTGMLSVIEQLRAVDVLPIFCSSDYVFDGARQEGYPDDFPVGPNTEYGRHKAEVETALAQSGQPYLVLRLGRVFGTRKEDGTLLDEMAGRFAAGQSFRAAHDQIFAPIWIADLCRLVMEVQRRELRGVVNLCSPETWSRYDLACLVAEWMRKSPNLVQRVSLDDVPGLVPRPKCTRLLPLRLIQEVSCEFTSVESCVEQLVEDYRQ